MALPFTQLNLNRSVYNPNIEKELAELPFADFVATGQKRLWTDFTLEEKKELAKKFPARNDLPHNLRVITALTTTHELQQPSNYYRLLKATGGYVNAFSHGYNDPHGFTTSHALLTNTNSRKFGIYFAASIPILFTFFWGCIAYKQYDQGFWFKKE